MPRTSIRTVGESRERSTSAGGSACSLKSQIAEENLCADLDLPDRARPFASATAVLAARSPSPIRARAELRSLSLTGSTHSGKRPCPRVEVEETCLEIARTHD